MTYQRKFATLITMILAAVGVGTTGSGATVAHTYRTPGTYTVTLTVTDNGDATGVQSNSVTVVRPRS
jgi:PKD repeat protein